MSKLEELIEELCPDGVEYSKFGDIANIVRGASPRPISEFETDDENGVNWIKIGDVHPESKYITSTRKKITQEGACKSRLVKPGDFVLSNSMSFGRPYIMKITGCIHDGWLSISEFEQTYTSDFLYYLLSSNVVQKDMAQRASNGTVQNLNADIVKSLYLPLPPLPIQEEIVRILDKFTELTAELTVELTAEFTGRKKQYEYYRDKLLNFGDDVEWKTLGKVTQTTKNIKWSNNQNLSFRYIDLSSVDRENNKITEIQTINNDNAPSRAQQIVNTGDIIFGTTRPMLKRYCSIDKNLDGQICSTGFCILRADTNITLPKWIFYLISSKLFYEYVEKYQKGASYPAITNKEVKDYIVPIPSIAEQERIVAILDRFDILVNDITKALPAEIEARKQQYEYYRDKLLTFPVCPQSREELDI